MSNQAGQYFMPGRSWRMPAAHDRSLSCVISSDWTAMWLCSDKHTSGGCSDLPMHQAVLLTALKQPL